MLFCNGVEKESFVVVQKLCKKNIRNMAFKHFSQF